MILRTEADWNSPEYIAYLEGLIGENPPPIPQRVVEIFQAARRERIARQAEGEAS